MKYFKTLPGLHEKIEINEENFIKHTHKAKPYYHYNENADRCYAVCPACDNPIQIIGLFHKADDVNERTRIYGRHHLGDIDGLAKYDEIAYYNCPYSNPNQRRNNILRRTDNVTAIELLNLLRTQFDRVIYVLERQTGIKISLNYAEKLLRIFLRNNGWRIYYCNYTNLPFMLIYANEPEPLIGRYIHQNSNLYRGLMEHAIDFHFEDVEYKNGEKSPYVKIVKNNTFVKMNFYFYNHEINRLDDDNIEDIHETVNLVVCKDNKTIYEEVITIDQNFLNRLIHTSEDKAKRNDLLIEMAQRVITEELY